MPNDAKSNNAMANNETEKVIIVADKQAGDLPAIRTVKLQNIPLLKEMSVDFHDWLGTFLYTLVPFRLAKFFEYNLPRPKKTQHTLSHMVLLVHDSVGVDIQPSRFRFAEEDSPIFPQKGRPGICFWR